jgi:hypothetical protein
VAAGDQVGKGAVGVVLTLCDRSATEKGVAQIQNDGAVTFGAKLVDVKGFSGKTARCFSLSTTGRDLAVIVG